MSLSKADNLSGDLLVTRLEPTDSTWIGLLVVGCDRILQGQLSFADPTHAFDSGDANALIALELAMESFKQIIPTHKGDRATSREVIRCLDVGI